MGNITRRDFLKGGIAGAATLAASGLLNAVSAKESIAFADDAKDTSTDGLPFFFGNNEIGDKIIPVVGIRDFHFQMAPFVVKIYLQQVGRTPVGLLSSFPTTANQLCHK